MYSLRTTNQFLRDYKRMKKRGADMLKFDEIVDYLQTGQPIPAKYKDHTLKGDWIGYRDCHIESDWILIYKIIEAELVLVATRTGTHSDFGW